MYKEIDCISDYTVYSRKNLLKIIEKFRMKLPFFRLHHGPSGWIRDSDEWLHCQAI